MIIFTMIFISSCQKDSINDIMEDEISTITESSSLWEEALLAQGKKLENPYSVSNMQKAIESLESKGLNRSKREIAKTHSYVKFMPKDAKQLYHLEKDDLILLEYPWDYDFPNGIDYSFDDESLNIQDNYIPPQWTVVPKGYKFRNGIPYEIIEELYTPDLEEDLNRSSNFDEAFWVELQNESFRLTNNEKDIIQPSLNRSTWIPSGTIKYEENGSGGRGIIALEGVYVIMRRWFKSDEKITNTSGYFASSKSFSGLVKYKVKYQRDNFDLRGGSYGQAYSVEVEKNNQSWHAQFKSTDSVKEDFLYCNIFKAAMVYFYKHNYYGLRQPYNKNTHNYNRLHIGVKNTSGVSHYFDFNNIWLSAPIVIYGKAGFNLRTSTYLFATTIHEIAHASHWHNCGSQSIHWVFNPKLTESFAEGVTTVITKNRFPNLASSLEGQDLTINTIKSTPYTPIVIDLMDNYNQSDFYGSSRPDDEVSGYTLSQLETALPSGTFQDWWAWRNNIKSRYNNVTENKVDYLFSTYNN